MNRRGFLTLLGIGAPAVAVAAKLPAAEVVDTDPWCLRAAVGAPQLGGDLILGPEMTATEVLGRQSAAWSEIFLAEGEVISFKDADLIVTHRGSDYIRVTRPRI